MADYEVLVTERVSVLDAPVVNGKDILGTPTDATFLAAIYSSTASVTSRSIFVDKGPLGKPALILHSGTGATLDLYNEVTLPGAALTLTDIGRRLTLSNSAGNDGDYKVQAILDTDRARVQANFALPDANSGSIDWEIVDPRVGQLADDPSDVVVRINGSPVIPDAVVSLLGQIVLPATPDPADDVRVDYTWCCNPRVEVRRLNSKEFRFNAWNVDPRGTDATHNYRYNNVFIDPSNYDPIGGGHAPLESPLLRQLKYRAYERAYTPVFNDPTLLLFNNPTHHIAFPAASRPLEEASVFYEGLTLPESDPLNPWTREGTGSASVAAGVLTVDDNSTGVYPTGEPLFWTLPLELTFEHAFAAAWRFSLDTVTTLEGVWTGVAAGYSDDKLAYVIGYLDDGGVKKIGFLKRGAEDDVESLSSWTGGIDAGDLSTNAPVEFDWSVLHSYRIFRDQQGVIRFYVDGDAIETLRILPSEAPFLEELNAPFDRIQGAFFGSLSRPAQSVSSWDFYRYLVQPTAAYQLAASSFVSYEANVQPEVDPAPWTPIGFHGTSTILSGDQLLLESTSASDSSQGLVGGNFRGYVRIEPLLSSASQFTVDAEVQLLTHTHGLDQDGLMLAVDDSTHLMQLCFIVDREQPRLSYGGGSFPEDFTPYTWSSLGSQPAAMLGRYLQISDSSITDGKVYFIEDTAAAISASRVLSSTIDSFVEARFKVNSFTVDGSGFAGAFVHAYDSTRSVGILLQEVAGVRYVSFQSEGVVLSQVAFEWDDGAFHTYRLRKDTVGDLVSLFIDGEFEGSFAYSSFTVPAPDPIGLLSFGSSTPASNGAVSDVEWAYCNAWRVNQDTADLTRPYTYVGIWKGTSLGDLRDYHLPLKAKGTGAVSGTTLEDLLADFTTAGVAPGDRLIVDVGANAKVYVVQTLPDGQHVTVSPAWPSQPTQVAYRIVSEVDWSASHKYRLYKDSTGNFLVFFDTDTDPLMSLTYGSVDLPSSGSGLVKTLSDGLPSVSFGSFSVDHLEQSLWEYVRYGITRNSYGREIVPPYQVLNQWNVMESPERLYTLVPHTLTDFQSSSTGITPQTVVDFLDNTSVPAYTQLNEGTPLVPLTQSFETQAPYPTQVYLSTFNNPEDVLNSLDFTLNDGAFRYTLVVPDDVLYSCLKVTETSSGEENLLTPFDDECNPLSLKLEYLKEVCLDYTADTLPEADTTAPTPWSLVSDDPGEVSASVLTGVLTYGTSGVGTRTVYLNNTPLPDAPSLQTEATFRLKLQSDGTLGISDSQVRFGLSAPGMTIGLGFVTTGLGDRFVLVFDIESGTIVGHSAFDYLDGSYHTYRIVRTPGTQLVQIFIDA